MLGSRGGLAWVVMCVLAALVPLAPADAQEVGVEVESVEPEGSAPVADDPETISTTSSTTVPATTAPDGVVAESPKPATGDRWPWPADSMSSDEFDAVLAAEPSAAEVEVVEDRTVDSKTFQTSTPGVYRTEFYTAPVHLEDEKGGWVDVSPDLVAEGGGLATAGVPFEAQFGVEGSGSDVAITTASGSRIGFDLGTAAQKSDLSAPGEQSPVARVDIVPIDDLNLGLASPWTSTSAEITVTGSGIKEMLYLSDSSAPSMFEFPLTLDGVTAVLTEAGSVDFIDGPGERVGTIPPAWMEDANLHEVTGEGVISTAARWELDKTDTGTELLRLVLDEKWLYSPDRVFPVRVDPTIVLGDDEAIDDTFVVPYSPGDRSLWDHIKIGHGGMFTNRTYINVAGLSQLSGKTIGHAELVLQQYGAACDSDPEDEPDTTGIEVHRVDEDWTGSSPNATVWGGPSVDVVVDSFSETVPACGGSFDRSIRLDVTEAVEQWASGGWAQQGLSVPRRSRVRREHVPDLPIGPGQRVT